MTTEQKRALIALKNLWCLRDAIREHINLMNEIDPEWGGPKAWDGVMDIDASNENSIELIWSEWDGCHCHGQDIQHTTTISTDALFMDRTAALAHKKALDEAKALREAKKREEEAALAAATARQKALDAERRERETFAKLQAKYGAQS